MQDRVDALISKVRQSIWGYSAQRAATFGDASEPAITGLRSSAPGLHGNAVPGWATRAFQMWAYLNRRWRGFSLSRQFALASGLVILLLMSAIGAWVSKKIEEGVTSTTGAAAALYMDAFIAPHARQIVARGGVSPEIKTALDEIMSSKEIAESVASIKIWLPGGTVVYSNIAEHIGRTYSPTTHLRQAWSGIVSAELDGHSHEDDHLESRLGHAMMEIYAPIREIGTNRIVAVSEFYMRADKLQYALQTARLQSWAVVGSAAGLMLLALYVIVRRGSTTIAQQQQTLRLRAKQNAELSRKIERAYWRADRLNEQFLRRVGADLHDGPAQYVGLALLRLDDLPLDEEKIAADGAESTHEMIRQALQDAIKEIRNLSRGLMLPQLDSMSINEAAFMLARLHKERTGSDVELDLPDELIDPPKPYKVCAYRFIQEALTNAYRHAGGRGQRVAIASDAGELEIIVSDAGPGLTVPASPAGNRQLGLAGIRDRVETLSGTFEIRCRPEGGTMLRVVLDTTKSFEFED